MSDETGSLQAQRAYWHEIERHFPWNVGVQLLQGALALFAMGFFAPETVLAAYLTTLTDNKFLIGLPWALSLFYWYFPAIFYSYRLQRYRQRKGVVIAWSLSLRAGFALFAASALAASRYGATAGIVLFLAAEAALVLTASPAALAWHDFVGRVLPPAKRGLIVGLREALGSLGGFAAAALLFAYLSRREAAPGNYFWPFVAGAFVYFVSIIPFAMTREPHWPGEVAAPGSWREYYAGTFSALREDANFRTYVFVRCLLAVTAIFNLGLFASYAITEFGVSRALVSGLFTAVSLAGGVIAATVTGRVADKKGFKAALLGGLALTGLMLVAGLSLKWMGRLATPVFFLIYFLAGAQGSAVWVANFNIMLEFGRVEDRPRYISLVALFACPVALAAALTSGLLVHMLGYRAVMLIALCVCAAVWATVYVVFQEPCVHRARREETAVTPENHGAPV